MPPGNNLGGSSTNTVDGSSVGESETEGGDAYHWTNTISLDERFFDGFITA